MAKNLIKQAYIKNKIDPENRVVLKYLSINVDNNMIETAMIAPGIEQPIIPIFFNL